MHRALELPGDIDLSDLSYFLLVQGIPHKVTEESGIQVVWSENEEKAQLVVSIYQHWRSGELTLPTAPPRKGINFRGIFNAITCSRAPVTFLFVFICIVVFFITFSGHNLKVIAWFSFTDFVMINGAPQFKTLNSVMDKGEYWRLMSPVFLHFGLTHLAFNMLGLYIFGSRLESRQGGFHLLAIIIFTAIISNFSQYFWGGQEVVFGGFSGVIYGLMGYCMMRQLVDPNWQFGIPSLYYVVMLLWLVMGYTGVMFHIGMGNIANAAHTGGLVAGFLPGVIAGLLFRE